MSAAPLALCIGAAALASAALMSLGRAPGTAASLALPALLLGPGLALLARWSPAEPSPWKLGLVAWLLSPPLFALLLFGLDRALGERWALPATLGLVGLGQLAGLGVRLRAEPAGRAAWAAALAGPLLAGAVLWAYAAAPILALWGDGLWWAGAALEFAGPGPLEDPWLAGTPLRQAFGPALLLSGFSRVLALEPSAALPLLAAWPLVALPLTLYFVAAPLLGGPRRTLLAVALALVGGGAGQSLVILLLGGASRPVDGFGPFVRALVGAPHSGPHGLPLAPFATAWIPGAACAAWAFSALALLAGVHALRHGQRPWVGLLGLSIGLTLLLDPALGLVSVAALAAAAVAAPGAPGVRRRVLPALALWTALGALIQPGAVWRGAELLALGGTDARSLIAGLGLLALAALCQGGGIAGRPTDSGAPGAGGQRTIRWLLGAAVLGGAGVAGLGGERGAWPGSTALLAQAALGILAAEGLARLLRRGGWRRLEALAISAALALGLAISGARTIAALGEARALDARATLEGELAEAPAVEGPLGRLWRAGEEPSGPSDRAGDRARAWPELAARAASIEPRPVLILAETQEAQRLLHAPAPHPAPLRAGIPLWVDRSVPHTRLHPRHGPRARAVRELFELRSSAGHGLLAELSALDRSAVLWVDGADRERSPDLEPRLHRLGFKPLVEVGEVTLYRWTPPKALAEGRAR